MTRTKYLKYLEVGEIWKPMWPCFTAFSPPGTAISPKGTAFSPCVGTKTGYMKAPKNMTLEKYLNISFPPPIRKQKKSTWSVSLFVWQICLLVFDSQHAKTSRSRVLFAGNFSIFFLCVWCALCTSSWWTSVQLFRQCSMLNFVVVFTTCSFFHVGCLLLSYFLEFYWSCQFEMLYGDSAKPTQSDIGHPSTLANHPKMRARVQICFEFFKDACWSLENTARTPQRTKIP